MAMPLGRLAVGTPAHALTSGGVSTRSTLLLLVLLLLLLFLMMVKKEKSKACKICPQPFLSVNTVKHIHTT